MSSLEPTVGGVAHILSPETGFGEQTRFSGDVTHLAAELISCP